MWSKPQTFDFTSYYSAKYCQNAVNDQRIVKIDSVIQQSRFTYVISHKYEDVYSSSNGLSISYYTESAKRINDAIEINTFKLQIPLLFIKSFASILDPYYAKKYQENNNKIDKILDYYKPKLANEKAAKKPTKKLTTEYRKTMRNIRLGVQTKKPEQMILNKDLLRKEDLTIVRLMEEFRTIKQPSTDIRARYDIYGKQKPKYFNCMTERGNNKMVRKSYADGMSILQKGIRGSNPDVYVKSQYRNINYKTSHVASIVNKLPMKANRFSTIVESGRMLYRPEDSLVRINQNDFDEIKGFFEISSINIGNHVDSSLTPIRSMNHPQSSRNNQFKKPRPSIHDSQKFAKQSSVNKDPIQLKPQPYAKEVYSARGNQNTSIPKPTNLQKSVTKIRQKLQSKSPLIKRDLKPKPAYVRSKSKTSKRQSELATQKLNIIHIPKDMIKRELKLNLVASPLNKYSGMRASGLNSDRTKGRSPTIIEPNRDLYKSYRPNEVMGQKSTDKKMPYEFDKGKRKIEVNRDIKLSIFKFKR